MSAPTGGASEGGATTGAADPHAVGDYPATEALAPIFMLLSVVGLGVAWRRERLGGTIAVVFQIATISALLIHSLIAEYFPRSAFPYLLSMIVAVPGILFLLCWRRSRKSSIPHDGD